jgi:hypothetical protein
MTPEMLGSCEGSPNLLLFFHTPLQGEDVYTIRYKILAEQIMYDLVDEKLASDRIVYIAEAARIESLTLTVNIPRDLDVTLPAFPEKFRPKDKNWKPGTELSADELLRLGPPPPGFKAIGWRTENLYKGDATGFLASATACDHQDI